MMELLELAVFGWKKLEAELVFRIWRCVKLCQTHPNFQLKSLLQALKKMAACNTHPASIDCCKTAVITWSFVKKNGSHPLSFLQNVSMMEPLNFKYLNYSLFVFQIFCTEAMHVISVSHFYGL
jgi:hypothetical protein